MRLAAFYIRAQDEARPVDRRTSQYGHVCAPANKIQPLVQARNFLGQSLVRDCASTRHAYVAAAASASAAMTRK